MHVPNKCFTSNIIFMIFWTSMKIYIYLHTYRQYPMTNIQSMMSANQAKLWIPRGILLSILWYSAYTLDLTIKVKSRKKILKLLNVCTGCTQLKIANRFCGRNIPQFPTSRRMNFPHSVYFEFYRIFLQSQGWGCPQYKIYSRVVKLVQQQLTMVGKSCRGIDYLN